MGKSTKQGPFPKWESFRSKVLPGGPAGDEKDIAGEALNHTGVYVKKK